MRFIDLETKKSEINKMNDMELTDYVHSTKQLLDLAKAELDERMLRIFPELTKEQLQSTSPVVKIKVLHKLGERE